MKVEVATPSISVKNVPDSGVLERCHELGKTIAVELLKRDASN
jgi:flavorubredoxin